MTAAVADTLGTLETTGTPGSRSPGWSGSSCASPTTPAPASGCSWRSAGSSPLILGIFTIIIVVQDETVLFGDFVVVAAYLTSFLLPILAIMLVTTEFSQRSALVTFSLEPRRERVILAKMVAGVVLTLITLVAAFVIGLVCNLVCEIANPDLTGWQIGAATSAGFTVTQTLAMLGGFAIATLLLNTPAVDRAVLRLPLRAAHRVRDRRRADGLVREAASLAGLPGRAGPDLRLGPVVRASSGGT